MKKLIAATLALTLLGSSAALADGYRGHDNRGAFVAGVGLTALALIALSQSDRDRYEARGYYYAPNGYYYRTRGDYDRYHAYYGDRDGGRRDYRDGDRGGWDHR